MELALITPVMLLLLVGAIDLGRLFYTYVSVENAAREGAAFGMASPTCVISSDCADPGNITYAARQEIGDPTDTTLQVNAPVCAPDYGTGTPPADCSSAGSGDGITVTVTYPFSFIFPLIPSVTLSSSATAAIQ